MWVRVVNTATLPPPRKQKETQQPITTLILKPLPDVISTDKFLETAALFNLYIYVNATKTKGSPRWNPGLSVNECTPRSVGDAIWACVGGGASVLESVYALLSSSGVTRRHFSQEPDKVIFHSGAPSLFSVNSSAPCYIKQKGYC